MRTKQARMLLPCSTCAGLSCSTSDLFRIPQVLDLKICVTQYTFWMPKLQKSRFSNMVLNQPYALGSVAIRVRNLSAEQRRPFKSCFCAIAPEHSSERRKVYAFSSSTRRRGRHSCFSCHVHYFDLNTRWRESCRRPKPKRRFWCYRGFDENLMRAIRNRV